MLYKAYGELPEKWQSPPEVPFYESWILSAFYDLSTCRSMGMGIGPIPWTAVREYADFYQMDMNDFLYLFRILTRLDSFYIKLVSEDI